jgi:hypothetical protein
MSDAVFVPDGEVFVPTDHASGPWDAAAMHGGAPAGLLARAMERLEGPDGLLARLTVDLLGPVPVQPVTVTARVVRPGKRVQVMEAEVEAGGRVVVRGRGLRVRTADMPDIAEPDEPPPGPLGDTRDIGFGPGEQGGFVNAHDIRFLRGEALPGPAVVWMRLRVALVAGEEPTGVQRAVCAADFANGVAAPLDWDRYVFINPDLNVHLRREPAGEWICLEARSVGLPNGIGQSDTALYDERGRIGRSVQALYVDARAPA